ncbi:MAG: hypothetical protein B6D41_05670 [Chloroflexi bacterium UTCFX4]|jgi:hypothetical protein|nr:MAG: hypothetical protein B6D41_19400 [Chloroflexi bacterium UTCFX4]OQY95837.1 MAG: hypothetical protein B6D41_05670 [Chloroflexi bacterium UTCFX4]
MLFHVTMTHTAGNCPGYHVDTMPQFIASLDKLEQVGKELGVKAHALLWGAPDHVAFAVLEAESVSALARYLTSIALAQEFKITPVEHVSELMETGKAMIARAKK